MDRKKDKRIECLKNPNKRTSPPVEKWAARLSSVSRAVSKLQGSLLGSALCVQP